MTDNTNSYPENTISANLLPRIYRSDSNKKFLQATIDQLIQPGSVQKINGFIGRQNSKATLSNDVFVTAASDIRQHYQLEPGLVIKDALNNVTFFKDYQDYINQIKILGGIVDNHARLNEQEFYSWNPHICWDKFVNFQKYYWVPNGPKEIVIDQQPIEATSRYEIVVKVDNNQTSYRFSPKSHLGLISNPTITLYRGQTYYFEIYSLGNPFGIRTSLGGNYYRNGVSVTSTDNGVIKFIVPDDAPDILYYQSDIDSQLNGQFNILSVTDSNKLFDIEQDILGKKSYSLKLSTGFELTVTNGLKLLIKGDNVHDSSYKNIACYVEGVGDSIKLVPVEKLQLFNKDLSIKEDVNSSNIVYVTINKANQTYNQWSRYNRWFHYDVLKTTADYYNESLMLLQNSRAKRPIIEFNGELKLFNYGTIFVEDVDLYDDFTINPMSLNGLLDYYIDGIQIGDDLITKLNLSNVRVLFAKSNKIYTIKYDNDSKLTVTLANDGIPEENQVVLIKQGINYSDKTFWYTKNLNNQWGWKPAQQKNISIKNQAPLFDVFDNLGHSFGDSEYYNSTTFKGTEIFSYKINENNVEDPVLRLKLFYKNIENSGDIVFDFDFDVDYFYYKNNGSIQKNINTGFLQKNRVTGENVFVNGWITSKFKQVQPAIRIYKNFNLSISDEDKNAIEYNSSTRYYPGDIIRASDGNLYQIKNDGSVSDFGIVGIDPITSTSVWNFYKKSLLQLNDFDIDIFNNLNDLDDLIVQVYVNDVRLPENLWHIEDGKFYKKVVLNNSITYNDVFTIKAFAKQPINNLGYYQIPINLQQNPLNQPIQECTFGEIIDHVNTAIDNFSINNLELSSFSTLSDNLRNLSDVVAYGTKFIQHSGPLSLSLYHITSEINNVVKAIIQTGDDYNKFKRSFITTAETLGVDTDVITHVNLILQELNKNKSEIDPYYLSDMVPHGAYRKNDFIVIDPRIKQYPLSLNLSSLSYFNLDSLSNTAVCVYLNGDQLCHGRQYTFTDQGFIEIKVDIQLDDIISIYEYDSTDGCFVPETPTKLGLWPKYEPKIYWDTTLVVPRVMIQGHDGSLTLAYGTYPAGSITQLEYRDALLLELEKRIYNNIKVTYNSDIFDLNDIIPSYIKDNLYNINEFNMILAPNFYKWTNLVGRDFTKPLSFNENNEFTFNYDGYTTLDNRPVPRYWRGIYQWILGTDRPHLCPWEMLGLSEEPIWWSNRYGPAPYTSNNILMWKDISLGIIHDPDKPIRQIKKYSRDFLLDHLPVDQNGNLVGPLTAGLVKGSAEFDNVKEFIFGDVSPVEAAWRRSSHYSFSVISSALLMFPAKTFGLLLDTSRIVRNIDNQIVYKDTNTRINSKDIVFPNIIPSQRRTQTAGIINYLINYIVSDKLKSFDQYQYDFSNLQCLLSYRIGGFTSKDKFNLLLDSKSPVATGNVFVPKEDYEIFLNSSSPIKKISYSGVIITKLADGFEIKGYIRSHPYFKYYKWIRSGKTINVGGISESYLIWAENERYTTGKIVEYNDKFYRTKSDHISSSVFDPTYYQLLPSLPIIGGKEAILRKEWDRSTSIVVPYGTKLASIQDVVDFLLGYGEWLKDQGFIFDQFNNTISEVLNWETSAKEFLFWTTQNWSTGQDKWDEWDSTNRVPYNTIVRYNGDYYKAVRNVPAGIKPNETDQYNQTDIQYYEKLDGLSTVGSSVISLSPSAFEIVFNSPLSVVNDIRNQFYEYEIFSVNGTPISPSELNVYKENNTFKYSSNTEGIYGATFYLIQKEQVLVINNTTIFNDLIYSPPTGYKQNRIKVSGYVTTGWDGSFNAPGFIFDQAKIQDWIPWYEYSAADIVKYKEFYYSAKSFIPGSLNFDSSKWIQLEKIPSSRLIPNWSYKASQFTDFHNLDSDNFDSTQQQMAQHLIGYQKRQYLNNIIKDDVSEFKFYQGMIVEKGTQNVFNKLFDALSTSNYEGMEFYEEWALRVARYGAVSSYDLIEINLDESKFKSNPQGFELVNVNQNNLTDFIIRQTPSEIYVQPQNYNSTPFPVANRYKSYFRSAGAVQEQDVRNVFENLSEIVNEDISKFVDGDYIWCTFVEFSWDVYKFVVNNHIFDVVFDPSDSTWIVNVMIQVNLSVGDYIGLLGLDKGNGFYQITQIINDTTFKVKVSAELRESIIVNPNTARLAELVGQKVDYFDLLANNSIAVNIFTKKLKRGNLLWAEGDLSTPWTDWIYDPVYRKDLLPNYFPAITPNFGKAIATNLDGTIAVISSNSTQLSVFDRPNSSSQWNSKELTDAITIYQDQGPYLTASDYFEVLAMSKDGRWLAASSPSAKNVSVELINGLYINTFNTYDTAPYDTTLYDNAFNFDFKSQGVVSLYEKDAFQTKYKLRFTFASPDCLSILSNNERFGSSLVFGDNILFVGAENYNSANGTGKVYSLKYNNNQWSYDRKYSHENNLYNFGHKLAINSDNSILAISATGNSFYNGAVNFYNITNSSKILQITKTPSNIIESFGNDIAFSVTDNYIAISSNIRNKNEIGQGIVYIYSFDIASATYIEQQQITRLIYSDKPGFGDKIAFIKNYNPDTKNNNTLVIYDSYNSIGYDILTYDSFIYDNELYPYELSGLGLVNIYDVYFDKWVRSEVVGTVTENIFNISFGEGFTVSNDTILIGAPKALDYIGNLSGSVFEYKNTSPNKFSWTIRNSEQLNVDATKIKKAFLYNKITNKLVTYLDVIDCFQGKIPGIADQEIKFKTYYDPAIYNDLTNLDSEEIISLNKNNSIVNINNGTAWNKEHVGTLWWDLKKVKFVDVYNKNIVFKNNFQNTLVKGGSIDIYEWVESKYKPSEWNELADTEEGYSLGISGTSLYDDSIYSIVRQYDKISKSYKSIYYYWVKNKKTIPNIVDRKLSSYAISNLISNARGQDYRYLTVTGVNSFSLVNVEKLLISNEIVLAIEYWLTDNKTQNIHAEWKLINNERTAQIPKYIEQKWFDSLVGKDLSGLSVPNMSLAKKIRYGIENKPRQGMFINRFEALKELVDYANIVLASYQIVEQRDISKLENFDQAPKLSSGKYDIVVDNITELTDINTQYMKTAILTPVIQDGRIISVTINYPGKKYGTLSQYAENKWNGPNIIITGNGRGASTKSIINSQGEIIEVIVLESGIGYDDTTQLIVRNYSVLVESDSSSLNRWSIYSYNFVNKDWDKVISQSYDIKDYWYYIDWYSTGYDQFSSANYAVDSFSDLITIDATVGDLIKIRNGGAGKWVLLKKYSNIDSVNWNDIFEIVGIEDGTIQLKAELYGKGSISGYDGTFYDSVPYDSIAFIEIRSILETLRDDIFIDDLRVEYLNLFFTCLRYVLSEQNYVDWAFKTSFIKSKHNVGHLNQKITYQNDNLENYEDYIAEVKPYRTKIREYVSCYHQQDNLNVAVTDFDLPPIVQNQKTLPINVSIIDQSDSANKIIVSDSDLIQSYPWKYWYDNCKPSVLKIEVIYGGSGYESASTIVLIVGDAEKPAVAKAVVENGTIVEIIVIDPGQGYYITPAIQIIDTRFNFNGQSASAVAVIGSIVRSPLVKMKFDRINSYGSFEEVIEVEEFEFDAYNNQPYELVNDDLIPYLTNNNYLKVLELKYAPSCKIGETVVYINDFRIFDDSFSLETKKIKRNGYTNFIGLINIKDSIKEVISLSNNNKIKVEYYRDQSLLDTVDRINYYYKPEVNALGKNINQLMPSIDYSGVSISGLNFAVDWGWNSVPFYTNSWDSFDESFDDVVFTVKDKNNYSIYLGGVLPDLTELNLYYIKFFEKTITIVDPSNSEITYNLDKNLQQVTAYTTYITNTINSTVDNKLTLLTVDNININDVVTEVNTSGYFAYDCRVKEIDAINNIVTLSHFVLKPLSTDIDIQFLHQLIEPDDLRVYPDGTLLLTNPIPYNYSLNIEGYYRSVRLDDRSFGMQWSIVGTDDVENAVIVSPNIDIYFPFTFNIGDPIKFTGTTFGNILENEIYYVHSILDGFRLKISASKYGQEFNLITASGDMTLVVVLDPNIIMPTWVSDGIQDAITIPNALTLSLGDKFILRKTYSDGAIKPHESTYDLDLTGGDLAYSSAKGILVDDIIIDGNEFYNTIVCPTLEEIVPGHVIDTVAIKVYDKLGLSTNISTKIQVDRYTGTGSKKIFKLSQIPNDPLGIFVTVDNQIKQYNIDYTVNYNQNTVNFITAPVKNKSIAIFTIGFSETVRGVKYLTADGINNTFIVNQSYYTIPIIYVNGVVINAVTFEILDDGRLSIKFAETPQVNSLITVIFVNNDRESFVTTKTERFVGNNTNRYNLVYESGLSVPYEPKIIVKVDQNILYSNEYTYTAKTENTPATIEFLTAYNSENIIEVTSSYNHDILNIQRSLQEAIMDVNTIVDPLLYRRYTSLASGLIFLDRPVINNNYVWVIQNKKLLTPVVDYKLNEDHQSIQLVNLLESETVFDIITFDSNVQNGFAYMQFKDMLNRTRFVRLNQLKQTKLIKELRFNDLTIEVENASKFDAPNRYENRPGIIEINGERIEYFSINGNVLGNLRRGTLGTGVADLYPVDTIVQEIGLSETLPYNDSLLIDEILYNNSRSINLSVIDNIISDNLTYKNEPVGNNSQLKAELAKNSIDIFVGGYKVFSWKPDTQYRINDLVTLCGYTYRCIENHLSNNIFRLDFNTNKWEFFVEHLHLAKNEYAIYNFRKSLNNPKELIEFDVDYTANGVSNEILLSDRLLSLVLGTKIIVTKRKGLNWGIIDIQNFEEDNSNETASEISKIIKFIKAVPGSTIPIIR